MSRRSRGASGSDLIDTAAVFRGLPLVYSIVAAALVVVLCEVVAPLAAPSYPKTGQLNFAVMFLPFIQIIGGIFAVLILLSGLIGAGARWFQRRRDTARFDGQTGVDSLRRLSWQEFERLIGAVDARPGTEVSRLGGLIAAGGAGL